jgi:hypothetical protein
LGYIAVAAVGCLAAYFVNRMIPVDGILGLILSGFAAVAIFTLIILTVYSRSRRFKALAGRFIKRGFNK